MSRSRIATATLACALAVSTVHVPAAEAQSSGSSTSTVDQQGFDEATAKWQLLLDEASASLRSAQDHAEAAQQRRDAANADLRKADEAVEAAQAALDAAEAELAWAKAADQDALAAAVEAAQERLAEAEQNAEDAYLRSGDEQMLLDEAEDHATEAQAEVRKVNAQRPTLAQYTTTETNTVAIVLGVLAALAVVGIGVVALASRLGIELPWQ